MTSYFKIALVAGVSIAVGLLICAALLIFANKNHKVKTEYDERQKAIMGKSYTYGFWAVIIVEALFMCLRFYPSDAFPVPAYLFHVFPIYLGLMVVSVYQIWKRCVFGLNNNRGRYIGILIVAGIINTVFAVCLSIFSNGKTVYGYYDLPYVNILCEAYIIVMCIAALIRWCIDRGEKEE